MCHFEYENNTGGGGGYHSIQIQLYNFKFSEKENIKRAHEMEQMKGLTHRIWARLSSEILG